MFGLSLTKLKMPGVGGLIGGQGRPVSIDFGTSALKVLELSDAEPAEILAAGVLPTPETLINDHTKRFAYQIENLGKLVKAAGIRGKRAVVAIPSWATVSKHMQVPSAELAGLNAYVASMTAADLACDPSTLVCRPLTVAGANAGGSPGGGKTEVISVATSRGVVSKIMEAVRGAKLSCVGIVPETVALARGFDHMTSRESDAGLISLYLDIGLGSTRLVIAHGREVVFIKNIAVGGRYLDEYLAQVNKITMAEASTKRMSEANMPAVKKSEKPAGAPRPMAGAATASASSAAAPTGVGLAAGMPHLAASMKIAESTGAAVEAAEDRRMNAQPAGTVSVEGAGMDPALAEPLSVLTDEASLCLRYHEALFPGRKIGRAIFVGGEARHLGICQSIAKAMRLPASVADPLARFSRKSNLSASGVDLSKPQPGFAVCAGLAFSPTDL
ncbi:MAG: pilus assembly protein PilM [Phycisphaerales bacterium]|nr:pilus assembly protein PilM [Phycisphaerales bacterium]